MRAMLIWGLGWMSIPLLGAACQAGDMSADEFRSHLTSRFQTHYIAPYVAGDSETWTRVFAEDVVALHNGLPALTGKAAVRDFAKMVAASFVIEKMEAVVDEIRRQGDWAWTRGRYDTLFTARSPEAPPGVAGARSGKFLLIWERQEDGQWLVILDMGNADARPAATGR